MHVVWHQAVRTNRELLDRRSTTELLQGPRRDVGIAKGFDALVRAERQEIARTANVVDAIEQTLRTRHDD